MTEPVEGLRELVDVPSSPPEPIEELRRRVGERRRRRAGRRVAVAGIGALVAMIAAVPLVHRASEGPTRVAAGPAAGPGETSTTAALEFVAGQPIHSRIDVPVPSGWVTLLVDGDRRLVGTRPLSEPDRALAVLARNDAAFAAFPADGVVVVVGMDPLQAKYGTDWDGTPIDNGPVYGLGPERTLPGGVRVRRGEIPQSVMRIASYAGPAAPATRLREAEAVAAGISRVRTGDPSVLPPPPPPGSTAGLPGGPLPVAEEGLPEVARTATGRSPLVVVAGRDCAYVRPADAQTFLSTYQPLAGGCGTRPASAMVSAVGRAILLMGAPGTPPSTAVIIRAGPGIRTALTRLADGRSLPAVVGTDGWGLAVGDGRVVGVTGVDGAGRQSAETLID